MILREDRGEVHGLTTAVGIWTAVGTVGLAVGAGSYTTGITAAVLILFSLTAQRVRKNLRKERGSHQKSE